MIEKGIKISKMVHRGPGLGHKDGKTYMVYYALPDEIVDAEIIMTKKSYSIGKAVKIDNPSPFRIDPICDYYQICGGCQYMHSTYNFQLQAKREILKELLVRALRNEFDIKCISSEPSEYYRLRAQFIVRGGKTGFTKFNSNEFVKINKCIICHKMLNEALKQLNNNISAIELDRLFIATDGQNIASFPIKDLSSNLSIIINRLKFILKPQVFFQANIYTLEKLQNAVLPEERGICAIDFYAGSGFFSLGLSKYFEYILAVEEVPAASNLLKKNILANDLNNIDVLTSSVENANLSQKYNNPDLMILDPPRSGMSRRAINKVLTMKPKRIFYVSCDPATLSRDVSYLYKNFYNINEIILLDQFPHTFHFETIVKMTYKGL